MITAVALLAASTPMLVGTENDIRVAAAMAAECGVSPAVAQPLDGRPALWIDKDRFRWETGEVRCFFEKLKAHRFSDALRFVGNEK